MDLLAYSKTGSQVFVRIDPVSVQAAPTSPHFPGERVYTSIGGPHEGTQLSDVWKAGHLTTTQAACIVSLQC